MKEYFLQDNVAFTVWLLWKVRGKRETLIAIDTSEDLIEKHRRALCRRGKRKPGTRVEMRLLNCMIPWSLGRK